jgi:hypothetical protein
MKRWACMSAERRRQYVLRWERRLQAIRDAGFEVVEAAEIERLRKAHKAACGGDELLRAAFTRLLDRLTRERDEARARALKLWAVLEMVRDADNDCRVEGWATIPDAARRSIDEALEDAEVERLRAERDEAQSSCAYPDCVDLGPNGKCTKWLTGKCNPVLEAKP